jgi:hypothetical protein
MDSLFLCCEGGGLDKGKGRKGVGGVAVEGW